MTASVVFIDSRVANIDPLIAGLDPSAELVLLNGEQDGLLQMATYLTGRTGIDSVQILSHGSKGMVYLGSTLLNNDSIGSYSAQLAVIGSSLTKSGDLLLYGCNVAAGSDGQKFIDTLATLTGADVAASENLTGVGGDWQLEVTTGSIEAPHIDGDVSGYAGTLAVITGSSGNDSLEGTVDADTIEGLWGSDTLIGGGGDDFILGGDETEGGDMIHAGPGNDLVQGGAGDDNLTGGEGSDSLYGGDGNDYLYGDAGSDSLDGGAGDDRLNMNSSNGNDTLVGGDGNDEFTIGGMAESQQVEVDGGAGHDRIVTSQFIAANLMVTGGTGSDTYAFARGDATAAYTVTDFAVGVERDRIDLGTLLDYSASDGRGYTGGNPMDPAQGYVQLVQNGDDTWLQYDSDGAAGTSYDWHTAIILQNVAATALTADNFVGALAPDGAAVPGVDLAGTEGDDTLTGGYFDDTLVGAGGMDQIDGSGGDDLIVGGDEADIATDILRGGAGHDTLQGGAGDDLLYGDSGNDSLVGGSGNDYLSRYNETGNDTLRGEAGDDDFNLMGYDLAESVVAFGGSGNDTFWTNTPHADTLTITGGEGMDTYVFAYGAAAASYTITDFAVGAGGDRVDVMELLDWSAGEGRGYVGGNPFDLAQGYLRLQTSGSGDTLLQYDEDGAAGTNHDWHTAIVLQGVASTTLIAYNFIGGITPDGSALPNKQLTGTPDDDEINGGVNADTLIGGAGADQISGYGGHDSMDGGDGNDGLWGGSGNDTLLGGAGEDNLNGHYGNDSLVGGSGADTLYGGEGNDVLEGGEGNDQLDCNGGSDTLLGGDGNDELLVSSSDSDAVIVVNGGAGDDLFFTALASGATFTATGGVGIDAYRIAYGPVDASYTITDFAVGPGGDRIDVSQMLDWSAGDGRGYIGGNPFHADLGYLRVVQSASDTLLQWDSDGGGSTWSDVLRLATVAVGTITSDNFVGQLITGTSGNDSNLVGNFANDTIDGLGGNDTLTGLEGSDTLTGGAGNDLVDGGQGNDLIVGGSGEGDDTYIGGEGIDTVRYTSAITGITVNLGTGTASGNEIGNDSLSEIENIIGGQSGDILKGNGQANVIDGYTGNDNINGYAGADSMTGGDGSDTYYVDNSGDVVTETNANAITGGADLVLSYLGTYALTGNVENGRILNTGAANLTGNELNNVLYVGAGNNILNGGSGTDTVSYLYGLTGTTGTTGVTVSLAVTAVQTTVGSGSDTLTEIENLTGSAYADALTGNAGKNALDGGAGVDTMTGGDGSDTYYARDIGDSVVETNANITTGGTDHVHSYLVAYTLGANVENGRILNTGAANLTGNELNNVLYVGDGNNILNGGSGTDTVSYRYGLVGTTGVTVSLAVTAAQTTVGSGSDTLTEIENLTGSAYADALTGNAGKNVLDGGAGVDTMNGGDGSDTYYVRDISDSVVETNSSATTGGTDHVHSYLADYTLGDNIENGRILNTGAANLTGNSLNNFLYAGAGNNILTGGIGTDSVSFYYGVTGTTGVTATLSNGSATATGGSGTDTLSGIERLYGSNNNDSLTGDINANYLYGYAGNDVMSGGNGVDTLVGADGKDSLTGGNGNDIFDFNALTEMGITSTTWDVITDFKPGDKIDLSTLDANTVSTTTNEVFAYLGSVAAFTAAGQLRYDATAKVLYGNTDANLSTAEFAIQLTGVSSLASTDFVL